MSTATMLPPLRAGEHLTSDEFLRRWEAMPGLKHAELIGGIVYMPSPVSAKHSDFHAPLGFWLTCYGGYTPGCRAGIEGTWLMGEGDVPQLDLALRILPEYGGTSRKQGVYSAGVPELIVEISQSSARRDLGAKLGPYERAGVREYVTAIVGNQRVVWRELAGSRYQEIPPDSDGVLRSRCLPGLWLQAAALWALDLPRLHATLQQGLDSREHRAFVSELQSRKRA